MKFFTNEKNPPITLKQGGSPAEHYCWCLNECINQLNTETNDKELPSIIGKFLKSMKETEITEKMIEPSVEKILLKLSHKPTFKSLLIDAVSKICIPDEGYLTVKNH